jgi:Ca2+-binding RTX toxin-like protein
MRIESRRPSPAWMVPVIAAAVAAIVVPSETGAGVQARHGIEPVTCKGENGTVPTTGHAEIIHGTDGADVIFALGGSDHIYTGGGDDLVCGDTGQDRVYGGRGRDRLYGEDGGDSLNGGLGKKDLCHGARGEDQAAPSCEKRKDI